MASDEMTVTILEDGSMKVDTGPISGPNHLSAENFIKGVVDACGGKAKTTRKARAQSQTHTGQHAGH